MQEVKTVDLAGPALDWAIAQIEGVEVAIAAPQYGTGWRVYKPNFGGKYSPSTDWAFGGPLVEKHRISFVTHGTGPDDEDGNEPIVALTSGLNYRALAAKTHLLAACRAIVAAKLGDTVQVPKELL
jgi:hypothetical protein